MLRGFGRLPILGRLVTRGGSSANDEPAAAGAPVDPDLAPLGPPVLLPSAIIRQVLFDATDFVPAWALPRIEPPQAAPPQTAKPTKRPRKPKASETSAPRTATAKPRGRARKASEKRPTES